MAPDPSMDASMKGKVALVTGAGGGIGSEVVRLFRAAGASVLATDIVAPKDRIEDDQVEFVVADVTVEDDVAGLVGAAVERFGRLDYAHNNAGINGPVDPIERYATEDWHRVLATNLTSVFLGLKHQLPALLATGGGAIVNTASYSGLVAVPRLCGYVAAKHGVLGLTKSAAVEYGHKGIRVNAVCPGSTNTAMIRDYHQDDPRLVEALAKVSPMRRLATPAEIAATVVWLCSDGASFVNGHALSVDGGAVIQ